VAFYSIKYLWNVGHDTSHSSWLGIVTTLIAFTPAAADTFTVVINRLKKKQSPMVGGKDHTTHHLVYSGLNDKGVWYVFSLIGLVSSVLSITVVNFIKNDQFIVLPIILSFLYFLLIFWYLYRNTIKYPAPKK
jgi:UDP-GlcNAc:undecaprenyl-phosphate GlcNAc-1-phosphate transferase